MSSFLPEFEIKYAAQNVLASYEKKHGRITSHVPVDDIIECHLGIHLEVFDAALLPAQYQDEILGYIDLHTNSIGIHESILPETTGNEGRYNFTLGHEAGHFVLHREAILSSDVQLSCFEQDREKAERDYSSIEWQADCFSGYFNMPDRLVHRYWKALRGKYETISLQDIAQHFSEESRERYEPEVLAEIYVKQMAKDMKVSAKALLIRLKRMGLIAEQEQSIAA